MPSFFEKLKNSMGVEGEEKKIEEQEREPEREARQESRAKKIEVKREPRERETPPQKPRSHVESAWFQPEGELAVDVYETNGDIVIQSTIAGITSEDLDVTFEDDVVTIRGERRNPEGDSDKSYFFQECYWGPFSRQIILPEEVDPTRAEATMKEGVFTLRIPKLERQKVRRIKVRG